MSSGKVCRIRETTPLNRIVKCLIQGGVLNKEGIEILDKRLLKAQRQSVVRLIFGLLREPEIAKKTFTQLKNLSLVVNKFNLFDAALALYGLGIEGFNESFVKSIASRTSIISLLSASNTKALTFKKAEKLYFNILSPKYVECLKEGKDIIYSYPKIWRYEYSKQLLQAITDLILAEYHRKRKYKKKAAMSIISKAIRAMRLCRKCIKDFLEKLQPIMTKEEIINELYDDYLRVVTMFAVDREKAIRYLREQLSRENDELLWKLSQDPEFAVDLIRIFGTRLLAELVPIISEKQKIRELMILLGNYEEYIERLIDDGYIQEAVDILSAIGRRSLEHKFARKIIEHIDQKHENYILLDELPHLDKRTILTEEIIRYLLSTNKTLFIYDVSIIYKLKLTPKETEQLICKKLHPVNIYRLLKGLIDEINKNPLYLDNDEAIKYKYFRQVALNLLQYIVSNMKVLIDYVPIGAIIKLTRLARPAKTLLQKIENIVSTYIREKTDIDPHHLTTSNQFSAIP